MELSPRLITTAMPAAPEGLVLVLHGGAHRGGSPMVSPTQGSVLRMIPIARRIARTGRGRLAVVRLLNSARGWDASHTPVDDARWALRELTERMGGALPPVCLVGHSLGGRAALLAAAAPEVRAAVALAPYVYESDGATALPDREVLIVHGTADRVASPVRSAAVARALGVTAQVRYVEVEGAHHAMLRRHGVFSGLAAGFSAHVLLGAPLPELLAGAAEPRVVV